MTHLPYIVASYALFLAVAVALAANASVRLASATRRLRAVDPRAASGTDIRAGGTTGASEA